MSFLRELVSALRRLGKSPYMTIPAVLTLALGIGASVATFAIVEAVVLQPLPYDRADRLARLRSPVPKVEAGPYWWLSKAQFVHLRESVSSFESLALYRFRQIPVAPFQSEGLAADFMTVAEVSGDLAETLGFQPVLGRGMTREDELGAPWERVWLSHALWSSRFDGDVDVIGKMLSIGGEQARIVGVLGPEAILPETVTTRGFKVDLWTPLALASLSSSDVSHTLRSVGRLAEGVSLVTANDELASLTSQLPERFPELYTPTFMSESGFNTEAVPLHSDAAGGATRLLTILLGATSLVLIVASASVGNLLLARAAGRRQEVALRSALGASRWDLALHHVCESLTLAFLAGLLAVPVARLGLRILLAASPQNLPRLESLRVGWPVVGNVLVLAVLLGLALGLLLLVRHDHLTGSLATSSRGQTAGKRLGLGRSTLIIGQMAFSLILLSGAMLLWQTSRNLYSQDPGIDSERAISFSIVLPSDRYDTFPKAASLYSRLAKRIEAIPGVEVAGLTSAMPLTGFDGCSALYVEDMTSASNEQPPCVPTYLVSPGFFAALGIPVQGRLSDWNKLESRSAGVVVSRALAQRLWPGSDPVGRLVRGGTSAGLLPIVAQASDVLADGLDQPATLAVYFPMVPPPDSELWAPLHTLHVVVRLRVARAPTEFAETFRHAVAEIDSGIAFHNLRTVNDLLTASTARQSYLLTIVSAASSVTVLLSLFGLYSLLSFVVAARRSEIGIRMALGAGREQVRWGIVAHSLRLTTIGIGIGTVASFVATPSLRSFLYGIQPWDLKTVVSVATVLALVAIVASWIPARRASLVVPTEAIRRT